MSLKADIGASDSNSYVTMVEAEAYFANRMHSASWDDLEDDVKESLLMTSSQMLDWYVTWKGFKEDGEQFLAWPRTNVYRPNGVTVDSGIIPNDVKVATYELAFSNISEDRTLDDPLAGLGKVAVGSLVVTAGPEKPHQTNIKSIPAHVYKIISDLYNSGNGISVVRLQRA